MKYKLRRTVIDNYASPLLDRKSLVVLGLNSNRRRDGPAVIRVTRRSGRVNANFLRKTIPYPTEIRRLIPAAADSSSTSANDHPVDNLFWPIYGRAARSYLGQLRRKQIKSMIASHEKTARHLPAKKRIAGYDVRGTLQLGSIAQIAAITGKVTAGDFVKGISHWAAKARRLRSGQWRFVCECKTSAADSQCRRDGKLLLYSPKWGPSADSRR